MHNKIKTKIKKTQKGGVNSPRNSALSPQKSSPQSHVLNSFNNSAVSPQNSPRRTESGNQENNSHANNSPANNSPAKNSPAKNSPAKNSLVINSPAKNSGIRNNTTPNTVVSTTGAVTPTTNVVTPTINTVVPTTNMTRNMTRNTSRTNTHTANNTDTDISIPSSSDGQHITFVGSVSDYACLFVPAIPCRPNSLQMTQSTNRGFNSNFNSNFNSMTAMNIPVVNPNMYMSKVYKDAHTRNLEWNRYRMFFEQGDQKRDFTTEMIMPCDADYDKLSWNGRKELESKCDMYKPGSYSSPVKQLYVKYGANTLYFFLIDKPFWSCYLSMDRLFRGIATCYQNGIILGDIRTQNIVFDHKQRRFLFSNFMNSYPRSTFYSNQNTIFHTYNSFFNPPEYRYYEKMINNIQYFTGTEMPSSEMSEIATSNEIQLYVSLMDQASNRYFKKYIEIVKFKGIDIPQSFRELSTTISSARVQELERFHQKVKELMQQSTGTNMTINFQRIMRNVPDTTGVYNMGAVLYDALTMSLYTSYYRDGSIEKGDKILWQKQYSDIFGRLSQLILKMMNANPYERIGAVEAYAEYGVIKREVNQRYPENTLLIDRSYYPMREEIRNAGKFRISENKLVRGTMGFARGTVGLTGRVARGTWHGLTFPVKWLFNNKKLIFTTTAMYYILKNFTPLRDAPGFMTLVKNSPEMAANLLQYFVKNGFKNIFKVPFDLTKMSAEQLANLYKTLDSTGAMSSNMIKNAFSRIFNKKKPDEEISVVDFWENVLGGNIDKETFFKAGQDFFRTADQLHDLS